MYIDLKQLGGCLGTEVGVGREGERKGFTKWHEETLGSDGHAHFLDYGDGFMSVNICQNLSRCTLLSTCNLLYVNHISTELFLNTRERNTEISLTWTRLLEPS